MHIRRFQEYFNHFNITILIPKWCKLPFVDSKFNKGDIRLYFKSYEKMLDGATIEIFEM